MCECHSLDGDSGGIFIAKCLQELLYRQVLIVWLLSEWFDIIRFTFTDQFSRVYKAVAEKISTRFSTSSSPLHFCFKHFWTYFFYFSIFDTPNVVVEYIIYITVEQNQLKNWAKSIRTNWMISVSWREKDFLQKQISSHCWKSDRKQVNTNFSEIEIMRSSWPLI